MINNLFFILRNLYKFINDLLHYSLYFNINILWYLNLYYFVLNHGHLHNFLNLFNSFLNNDFRYNSLDNLRNLYYFLYNSRNNNNFLNNLLNLNHLWNLDHFLNYLFYRNFDLFNPVNIFDNLNNLLFNVLNWFGNIDVMVDYSLNLDCLWLFDDNWISKVYLFNNSIFYFLNYWFLNYFLNNYDSFMDNWNLYYLFDFSWNLSYHLYWNLYFPDNLFNNFLNYYFLNYSFNFLNLLYNSFDCNHFLNNLRNLNNSFNCLYYRYWFFDNSIHDFVSNLYVIINLLCSDNFLLRNNYFYNFLDLDDFWHLNYSLYYLLNDDWNFLNYLYYSLCGNDFFNNYFNSLDFGFNMIYNSLYLNYSIYFYLFLLDSLDNLNFRNLSDNFNDSFDYLRNLNDSLDNSFYRNNFLYYIWYNCRNFKRNIYDSLYLSNFLDLNYLFNNFLDWNYLRNFYNSINYFLDNFFNLYDFGYNSKHFQDIIDIYYSHNLLVNHSNYTLINLKDCSSFSS
jgi:hypothetical protein